MLRQYYINKEWIVSSRAQWVYRLAAYFSLVLFFLLVLLRFVHLPITTFPMLRFLLFVGVLGAATTMVAMEYFLFDFDKSSAVKKVFWFCVMTFVPLGPALYCFFVYSRSDVLENGVRGANSLSGSAH